LIGHKGVTEWPPLHVVSFLGRAKEEVTDQNQELLMKWNNKFEIVWLLFLLISEEKGLSLCLPGCRSGAKFWGMLKSDTKLVLYEF
jgi:hypothetical protein